MKRIALWSGPRNISTALMYSFAQRPDTQVIDEPLFAYFLKHTGAQRPSREEVLQIMETDAKRVLKTLLDDDFRTKPVLFMKHMANHLTGLDLRVVDHFHNIILIRDPREVLLSYTEHVKHPSLLDLAYQQQWELVEYLRKRDQPVYIVDSRDILLDPEGQLKQICAFADLPWDAAMLSWPAGARKEDGIWAKYWYENLHHSTGFQLYQPKSGKVSEELQPLLDECRDYYRRIKA